MLGLSVIVGTTCKHLVTVVMQSHGVICAKQHPCLACRTCRVWCKVHGLPGMLLFMCFLQMEALQISSKRYISFNCQQKEMTFLLHVIFDYSHLKISERVICHITSSQTCLEWHNLLVDSRDKYTQKQHLLCRKAIMQYLTLFKDFSDYRDTSSYKSTKGLKSASLSAH